MAFLGLASYYRRYVKSFAAIAAPLHALMKKDVVFHWTPECQKAFVKLKHLLTTATITAFPDFNLPFPLYTDASTLGLGAILAQVQDVEREDYLLCFPCFIPDRKELSSHQIGVPDHCLGNH